MRLPFSNPFHVPSVTPPEATMKQRALGKSGVKISPVAMGCWPIAGMTSIDVNDRDSRDTLQGAIESGINFFDTAYCYGAHGESETLLGEVLGVHRSKIVYATKGGIHWTSDGQRVQDARPATLKEECELSLRRLGTDHVELYYLHAPDPQVPIADSAGAIQELIIEGKVVCAGVSNVDLDQLRDFQSECVVSALQPPYNMLQREIEDDLVPYCVEHDISILVYWPLMKGLLAGQLKRDHVFAANDGRAKYPMFQGEEWQKNQDFIDELRTIAGTIGRTVSQVVINWTIQQTGITGALCGAKRRYQIEETAAAMDWQLTNEEVDLINQAIARRGTVITRPAV